MVSTLPWRTSQRTLCNQQLHDLFQLCLTLNSWSQLRHFYACYTAWLNDYITFLDTHFLITHISTHNSTLTVEIKKWKTTRGSTWLPWLSFLPTETDLNYYIIIKLVAIWIKQLHKNATMIRWKERRLIANTTIIFWKWCFRNKIRCFSPKTVRRT